MESHGSCHNIIMVKSFHLLRVSLKVGLLTVVWLL